MKNTAKAVYEALQKEFGDKFDITLEEPRKGRGLIIILKKLLNGNRVMIRIMERSKKRLEPYFRIYNKSDEYFNRLGEVIENLDFTHLNLKEFSIEEIIELFKKALEYTLNKSN